MLSSRDEDDGNLRLGRREVTAQVDSRYPFELDVEDDSYGGVPVTERLLRAGSARSGAKSSSTAADHE